MTVVVRVVARLVSMMKAEGGGRRGACVKVPMTARVGVVVRSKGSSKMGMKTKKDEHEGW